jgi:hypothetical protein
VAVAEAAAESAAGGNGEDMWRAVVKVAGIECT